MVPPAVPAVPAAAAASLAVAFGVVESCWRSLAFAMVLSADESDLQPLVAMFLDLFQDSLAMAPRIPWIAIPLLPANISGSLEL